MRHFVMIITSFYNTEQFQAASGKVHPSDVSGWYGRYLMMRRREQLRRQQEIESADPTTSAGGPIDTAR